MTNLLKARMEDHQMYSADFSEGFGKEIGIQAIHFTKQGSCDMGVDFAWQYISGFKNLTGQLPLTGKVNAAPQLPLQLIGADSYDASYS